MRYMHNNVDINLHIYINIIYMCTYYISYLAYHIYTRAALLQLHLVGIIPSCCVIQVTSVNTMIIVVVYIRYQYFYHDIVVVGPRCMVPLLLHRCHPSINIR